MEMIKARLNRGLRPDLFFLRDKEGHEIDALVETAPDILQAVEMKSGATVTGDFMTGLQFWRGQLDRHTLCPWLIYGGDMIQSREAATVLPWSDVSALLAALRSS